MCWKKYLNSITFILNYCHVFFCHESARYNADCRSQVSSWVKFPSMIFSHKNLERKTSCKLTESLCFQAVLNPIIFHQQIPSSHISAYVKVGNIFTDAWKVSKYGVISGRYFPVFSPNTGKYGPEITPYLDTFDATYCYWRNILLLEEKTKLTSRITGRITHRKNGDLIRTPVIITQKPHFSHFFMIKRNLIKSMC